MKAINNCRDANLGVVLVSTLIKGTNINQVGDIISFAGDNIDTIGGINFQPVSFAGRTPSDEVRNQRITIRDFEKWVEEQTKSQIKIEDFRPAPCVSPVSKFIEAIEGEKQVTFTCYPHCGAATYVFADEDKIIPITQFMTLMSFLTSLPKSARLYQKWGYNRESENTSQSYSYASRYDRQI